MIDYSKGKIYKIVNDVNDIIYIGSTSLELNVRMSGHKEDAKDKNYPFYKAMREIGIHHFKILLMKPFPCNSRAELIAEEYKTIKELKREGVMLYNLKIDECHSEETRKKISEGNKGKIITDEHKLRISKANNGRHHTEQAKQKIRESKTLDVRKKMSEQRMGICLSDETKRKISQAKKGKTHSEESRKKMSISLRGKYVGEKNHMWGKHLSVITKNKLRELNTGRLHTEQAKQKISQSHIGDKSYKFSFGSIFYDKSGKSWSFSWYENAKPKKKSFSVNKYGHEQAIELCAEHRSKIYPNYQPKYVEIFFIDE